VGASMQSRKLSVFWGLQLQILSAFTPPPLGGEEQKSGSTITRAPERLDPSARHSIMGILFAGEWVAHIDHQGCSGCRVILRDS